MRSEHNRQDFHSILNISVVRSWQTLRARLAPFSPAPSPVTLQIVRLDTNLAQLAAELDAEFERQVYHNSLDD